MCLLVLMYEACTKFQCLDKAQFFHELLGQYATQIDNPFLKPSRRVYVLRITILLTIVAKEWHYCQGEEAYATELV